MVVMLQGFIVLFSGAMTYVIAPIVARVLELGTRLVTRSGSAESTGAHHG
jgi:simple sugar transport system permease protein